MKLDLDAARFRAIKEGNILKIQGAVTDATSLDALQEMAGPGINVDFSGVIVGSYTGVCVLAGKLNKLMPDCVLINVPFLIHQVLMVTECRDRVKSFESFLAAPNGDGYDFTKKIIEAQQATGSAPKEPVKVGDQFSLTLMTNDKQDQDKERVFRGIWAGQNNEEASFWVDYFGYLLNTVVQSEQTLGATVFALNRYLILIDMRITSFSAAWDLMSLPNRVGKWQGRAAVDKATQEAMVILEVVEKLREQCEFFMAKIIEAVEGKESDFWWVLDNIEKYKIHEAEAAKVIEATGVALGETLMSVEMFNNVRSDLNTGLAKLSEDQIAEVLDALDIMAPGAESDVEEARQEIVGEATLADKELTGCVILLQAFDLVRQILEHRRNEINIIPEMLGDYKKKEIHWTFLRDKIIDKLYGKMVTEQEKKAFAYFLHYLEPKQEEGAAASAPGDMMLF